MSIKRAFTNVFSSCNGPFLSCSAQAAQITGIESAIILNHLVTHFGHNTEAYIQPDYYSKAVDHIEIDDRIYFTYSENWLHDLFENILLKEDVNLYTRMLEKNNLVKYHKLGEKNYFTIMYDNFSFQDVEKERLAYIEKKRLESIERKEKKLIAKYKKTLNENT